MTGTPADGPAERTAAGAMRDGMTPTHPVPGKAVGADTGFDAGEFFPAWDGRGIEPPRAAGDGSA